MKRLFIGLVAVVMSVATGFAQTTNSEKEPFSADINKLSTYLALEANQVDEIADINNLFLQRQQESMQVSPAFQEEMLTQAVYENLQLMKYYLTPEQYRKYVRIINATNSNRQSSGSILPDVYLAEN
ncbi:hypothetical protein LJC43_05710 [Parabacteroides sp. OttesenSCG-928-G21]|nr:hypothetical protein [Parabacteroides sp. OttesenSCG-928-G21]